MTAQKPQLKLQKEVTVLQEIDTLVSFGSLEEEFGEGLKKLIEDYMRGVIAGRKLPDSFIALAKKHTDHGVFTIGQNSYQMLVMVNNKDHADTSVRHEWRITNIREGYYFRELSTLK